MRAEYGFSGGVRGVTSRRYARGRNTVTVTASTRKSQGTRANDNQWSQSVYEFVSWSERQTVAMLTARASR